MAIAKGGSTKTHGLAPNLLSRRPPYTLLAPFMIQNMMGILEASTMDMDIRSVM